MDGIEEVDRRGRALLAELARNPESECWRDFYDLFYEVVWKYLRANHAVLPSRVARFLRVDAVLASNVLEEEVDEVAHEATEIALRRVCDGAARFDLVNGSPTKWVIGSAHYAYVEVAKAIVLARRSDRLVFMAPQDLLDAYDPNPSTEEHVLRHLENAEALEDAANHVSQSEFQAMRLVITLGFSYQETADLVFGDATKTRKVDGLLTRGKPKLAEAWIDRRPSPRGASGSNVLDGTDDKEETDG
jgi:DNA-directed RNA polymerase specialized sigma24 family protein